MVASAFKQNHAEIGFKLFDGATKCRLGDVKPPGGAGEAEFFGHGSKILQGAQLNHSMVITARHHANSERLFPLQPR